MAEERLDRIGRGPHGRPMRRKNNGWFWSEEAEEEFFNQLAAHCNVRAAADAVGFCTPTVYRLRRTRPEFARRWDAALVQGYARLEMALLEAANDALEDRDFDDARPLPKMTVEQAMNVLRAHRNAIAGDGRGPGLKPRRRSLDEVRASILGKAEAILAMDEAEVAARLAGAGAVVRPSPDPSRSAEGERGL